MTFNGFGESTCKIFSEQYCCGCFYVSWCWEDKSNMFVDSPAVAVITFCAFGEDTLNQEQNRFGCQTNVVFLPVGSKDLHVIARV